MKLLSFAQAIEKTKKGKRHLLLGNGFSIACCPKIFNYESLFTKAKSKIEKDMPEISMLFKKIGDFDFENIIQILNNSAEVIPLYFSEFKSEINKIRDHSKKLKNMLIETIAENHPEFPSKIEENKFRSCWKFLANFIDSQVEGKIYTLNYDLLLYWTLMHEDYSIKDRAAINKNDGFGKTDKEDDYVYWKNEAHQRNQNIFFIHGAIHLFYSGIELEKYTWVNKGKNLIEQARESLKKNKFPLFVSEGNTENKLKKIRSNPYLHHAYKSFIKTVQQRSKGKAKSLFIHGHSLSENDSHIFNKIAKGKISKIFVSLYGDPKSAENIKIIDKANSWKSERNPEFPLEVEFYNAESANVWS